MSALFASRIRSIVSLALCGQTKLTDALREIVAECNTQNDQIVTLTVEQARAAYFAMVYHHCDGVAHDAQYALRTQLEAIEEAEQSDLHERRRAKQS